jgi:hypothetical protein
MAINSEMAVVNIKISHLCSDLEKNIDFFQKKIGETIWFSIHDRFFSSARQMSAFKKFKMATINFNLANKCHINEEIGHLYNVFQAIL